MRRLFIFCIFLKLATAVRYDSFTGVEATDELIEYYNNNNILENCTNDVELPCDLTARRRLDGTCVNAKYPSRGGYHTPVVKILPEAQCVKATKDGVQLAASSGTVLKTAREVRTKVLQTGKGSDPEFTQMLPNVMAITFNDLGSIHDSNNLLLYTTHCCTEAGKTDDACASIYMNRDDPVHRFSGFTCLNLTRPQTFQTTGCVSDSCSDRMEFTTALFDLSGIYRPTQPAPEHRSYSGGQLVTIEAAGTTFPSLEGTYSNKCLQNEPDKADQCFGPVPTSIPQVTYFNVWQWRFHNKLAKDLSEVNPSWDDDTLYETARDLNIAITNHLIYHELLPTVFGKEFCLEKGLITDKFGFRDNYDENEIPTLFAEYYYAMRWFHLVQEGTYKLCDENFEHVGELFATEQSLKADNLMESDNFAQITRCAYTEPAAARDSAVDPAICDFGLGNMHAASDLTAADLQKGRYFQLRPYVDYVQYCHNITISCWDDFLQIMPQERMEVLQEVYEAPGDVELLPGTWVENPMEGGYVPLTVACLLEKQYSHSMRADPHWYQRADRPYAFTEAQIQEIGKATYARFMCEVGDGVTKIQPDIFRRVSETNKLVSCDEIPTWDLSAWKES